MRGRVYGRAPAYHPAGELRIRVRQRSEMAPDGAENSRAFDRCVQPRRELGAQIEAPVVARHEVALGELELARFEQLEAELAADRVRRRIVDAWEGVHEAVLVVALGALDRLSCSRHRDAAALELGDDHPTDLVHLFLAPFFGPKADRA